MHGSGAYYLAIDDTGTRNPDRAGYSRKDGMDWFAFGGIVYRESNCNSILDAVADLKEKYEISVPLHSHSMRGFKTGWEWLREEKGKDFFSDLSHLMTQGEFLATACVINRRNYQERFKDMDDKWYLCKTAYSILVERVAKIALEDGERLHVYVEQSGKKEDRTITEYHSILYSSGPPFNPTTSAKYYPSGPLNKVLFKKPNFGGKANAYLQLADLVAYAIAKGAYDPDYLPYKMLKDAGQLIDRWVKENHGIKYYCFQEKKMATNVAKVSATFDDA